MGRVAHFVALGSLAVAVFALVNAILSHPGAQTVFWPLLLFASPLVGVAMIAGVTAVVASSIAARNGYPKWEGLPSAAVLLVALTTGCCGAGQFLGSGSVSGGGTRVGDVVWRQAMIPQDSYAVPGFYRCGTFGLVCTLCPVHTKGVGMGEAPTTESCPP